jgi:hypothetical protein
MPKQDIIELCTIAISEDLGKLDDLPYELANTVANVYYKYFDSTFDIAKEKQEPGWIPKSVKREKDMSAGLSSYIEDSARIMTDFDAAKDFVKNLRGIDKHKQPRLYKYWADFILDCLKYDIEGAQNKSAFRRMIERKFRKGKVREINNLIDLLDV